MSARLMVFTAPVEGREDEYDVWQSEVHIPELLEKVAGLASATRYRQAPGVPEAPGIAPYLTVYELSEPVENVLSDLMAVLPTLQQSDSLDVAEKRPQMVVYEAV